MTTPAAHRADLCLVRTSEHVEVHQVTSVDHAGTVKGTRGPDGTVKTLRALGPATIYLLDPLQYNVHDVLRHVQQHGGRFDSPDAALDDLEQFRVQLQLF